MIDIKRLAEIAQDKENVVLTRHVRERFESRNIKAEDVYLGFRFGEIIEQYPEDIPYPSCLILYVRINGKPMHFVCSTDNTKIYIITAYDPDLEFWEDDYKTRKKVSK